MCGIVGLVDLQARPAPIEAMRDTMRHRGPDGAGVWRSADGRVQFGHRRLAIVDLTEAGHQPMLDPTGTHILVFNGEIYNWPELRNELAAGGWQFRGHSDSEVVLAAYAAWGEACVKRLVGMFALAIYDAERGQIFAARDRAGEKPFFYFHGGGRFGFASELKALFAHPELPRVIDPRGLDHYLAYGYVPREHCMVHGFHKLPAGHTLTYRLADDRIETRPYWFLPCAPEGDEEPLETLVDALEPLLDDAVRLQLQADVPVGVLLSGGLDSSLIAATAARVSNRVSTFTIGFPDSASHDESPIARRLAAELGTDHTELMAEGDTVSLLPELIAQFDEPMFDSSMLPTLLVSRLVRTKATVPLGGDGGDELFGGYIQYQYVERMVRLHKLGLSRLGLGQAAGGLLPLGTPRRRMILRLLDSYDASITLSRLNEPARRRALAPLVRRLPEPYAVEEMRSALVADRTDPRERAMAHDFLTYMCDDILVKVDRASMLASLEVRAPLLDHRIVEFAFGRLTPAQRVNNGARKLLLRSLARRRLPAWFNSARKQGFSIPLAQWVRGPWRRLIEDVAAAPGSLLDPRAVRGFLKGAASNDSMANELFQLAVLELWRRQYNIAIG